MRMAFIYDPPLILARHDAVCEITSGIGSSPCPPHSPRTRPTRAHTNCWAKNASWIIKNSNGFSHRLPKSYASAAAVALLFMYYRGDRNRVLAGRSAAISCSNIAPYPLSITGSQTEPSLGKHPDAMTRLAPSQAAPVRLLVSVSTGNQRKHSL